MKKKIILTVVILIALSVSGYGAYTIYQIYNPKTLFEQQKPNTDNEAVNNDLDDVEVVAPEPEEEEPEEEYRFDEDRVNLLILGLDASEERYEVMKAFRTDTMIVMSIDFKEGEVYLISIPRDSYVNIPGRKYRDRINTAFLWGGGLKGKGFEKAIETTSIFLGGIPIQYYAAVDMNVFKEIIDVMGGVKYEVDVPVRMGGRKLEPGLQLLDGQQVLDYCRNRHSPRGDIDRIERQQKMILAIFNQLKSSEQLLKIPQYYGAIQGSVYTNLTIKQMAALGVFGMKLDFSCIHPYSIPGDFLNIDGVSYWGINQYKKRDMVKEIFGIEMKIDSKDDVKYIKKELKEKQIALDAASGEAYNIIESSQKVMTTYSNYINQDEKVGIDMRIKKVQQEIDNKDVAKIKSTSKELKVYADKVAANCEQRKKEYEESQTAEKALNDARGKARNAIDEVKARLTSEEGAKLPQNDKESLQSLINSLEKLIAGKNTEEITAKTAELKATAKALFDAANAGNGEQPPTDPDPEDNGQDEAALDE